jgi:hypothetical protein
VDDGHGLRNMTVRYYASTNRTTTRQGVLIGSMHGVWRVSSSTKLRCRRMDHIGPIFTLSMHFQSQPQS